MDNNSLLLLLFLRCCVEHLDGIVKYPIPHHFPTICGFFCRYIKYNNNKLINNGI